MGREERVCNGVRNIQNGARPRRARPEMGASENHHDSWSPHGMALEDQGVGRNRVHDRGLRGNFAMDTQPLVAAGNVLLLSAVHNSPTFKTV